MFLGEVLRVIDGILPPSTAMLGDNIGLQIESTRGTVERVLVCLEITDDVVREAEEHSCDTILTFHPLIYGPVTSLRRNERVGRLLMDLSRADRSVICVHTAYDAFPQGTNHAFVSRLGAEPEGPIEAATLDGFGMGLFARFPRPVPFAELVERTMHITGAPVRYSEAQHADVQRLAVVCGSGASFLEQAVAGNADVLLTADVKYHTFHAATGRIGIIDPGHYEMEQFVPEGIVASLSPLTDSGVTFRISSVNTNPVRYAALGSTIEYAS
jgi:dinuclear metal center YbgI/SA1388 family protein